MINTVEKYNDVMKLTTNFDCNGWGAEAKAHFNYTGKSEYDNNYTLLLGYNRKTFKHTTY